MAYEKQTWVNNDPATPLSAERLNHIEDGIAKPVAWADVEGKPSIPSVPAVMTQAEADAGTATTARTINAAVLKASVVKHAPAAPALPAVMTAAQATAGTATTGLLISPKVLADEVNKRVAAAVDPLVARIATLETKVAALESPAGE